jgi:hypothetical protein
MSEERNRFRHDYTTPIGRWAGVGPYYAMFPVSFAFDVVNRYSRPGEWIIDPFAGRFSSAFAAATSERHGVGIEINPVGWLYGQVKLNPSSQEAVEQRLREVCRYARWFGKRSRNKLPEFFHVCYSERVLSFLLAARSDLNWKDNGADATLMALILIFLHAKQGSGFSNQMRQSKAMAPDYSVQWWKNQKMAPPDLDPYDFMMRKIEWRYAQGIPDLENSEAILGDSTIELERIASEVELGRRPAFSLLLTSPPYHDITNYHYDQWLRLWMLGGASRPNKKEEGYRGRFSSKERYTTLLETVFRNTARLMAENSTIYIRTDARPFTLNTTRQVLNTYFPEWERQEFQRPLMGQSQTVLYGDFDPKPGEVDIILTRRPTT